MGPPVRKREVGEMDCPSCFKRLEKPGERKRKENEKKKKRSSKRRGLVVLGSGEENPGVFCSMMLTRNPKREKEKTPCGLHRDKLWKERPQNGATILARHGDYQLHKLT
ncbi:hypothetical protein TNCV_3582681 [Trichonephila clavipes]|nr:hypothetical protein TNCV_3582681 [Trichonephila clavipes]